jgi:GDP/UDP-N,N'-diacetylbacillosamine 2-epimerase (hydrolysing)
MRYCKLLIGNTSSGIIEAASFGKYVINVGDRQKGRAQSDNVVNCAFASEEIVNSYELTSSRGEFTGDNIYHMSDTAKHILDYLNKYEKL